MARNALQNSHENMAAFVSESAAPLLLHFAFSVQR